MLPAGEVGEIVVRTPSAMRGYYRDPAATAQAFRSGWLHTGDLGYLEPDGYLFVVGRQKDVIIVRGENLMPVDVEKVVDVISKGAAQSWQMENRYKTMNAGKFDFGFAVDWMRKDLSICIDEARKSGAKLPVAALVDQFYAEVQAMGGKRWDTSSLLARLEKD